ncbi:MAG: helix-turn-helix domain-containing protein [Tannerellaceae bacterium]|nr:helix-turn-helix domain-containing protein [Tannerellaceae bacterium]
MSIGENIKQLREKTGVTQSELAQKLNISIPMISQYENNKRSPKPETVEKIANALGVHPWDIDKRLAVKVYIMRDGTEVVGNPYTIDMAREHDRWEDFRIFLEDYGVSHDKDQKNIFTFKDTGEKFLVNEKNLPVIVAEQAKILIRLLGKDPTAPDPE